MKKLKKGFTLIELIAVLVIMAIIALIVTPLVMNIIRSARVAADKRSIDAYGRSIELAIAGYLLDNGKFPTDVSQLTIEYSGNQVACETTQLNSDSSVYLSGCRVAGRSVDYAYGNDKSPSYTAYSVGNQVTYNNVDYYVIKNSGIKESIVTLLKAEPLTVDEVNDYGTGHVNRYTQTSTGTVRNEDGYGSMVYYSSETCGFDSNEEWHDSGCTNEYAQSDVKYVVDAWKNEKAPAATETRLITKDELINDFGYVSRNNPTDEAYEKSASTPNWVYNSKYSYWTMSPKGGSLTRIFVVAGFIGSSTGELGSREVGQGMGTVRPVIVLPKSALQ